jgi:hypothetical protein
MGQPLIGWQKGQAAGGCHEMVGTSEGVEGQQRKQQERLLVRAARQWKH